MAGRPGVVQACWQVGSGVVRLHARGQEGSAPVGQGRGEPVHASCHGEGTVMWVREVRGHLLLLMLLLLLLLLLQLLLL